MEIFDKTLLEVLQHLRDTQGGCLDLVLRDADGNAIAAFIIVDGREETDAVVNAVYEVVGSWQ